MILIFLSFKFGPHSLDFYFLFWILLLFFLSFFPPIQDFRMSSHLFLSNEIHILLIAIFFYPFV
jgi:hypothetical protein